MRYLLVLTCLFFFTLNLASESADEYSFLVAGHTYGHRAGQNIALYPKFLEKVTAETKNKKYQFIIFLGDLVRHCNKESWALAAKQRNRLNLTSYVVLGNHDYQQACTNYQVQEFGNTFYYFEEDKDLFLVLDTTKNWHNITKDQLTLITDLAQNKSYRNVFILTHQLLWMGHPKFKNIKGSNFSRFNQMQKTNFWSELMPLLKTFKAKNKLVLAGDTGNRQETLPLLYHQEEDITFIATGMGALRDENFLSFEIKPESINIKAIALNDTAKLQAVKAYSVDYLSQFSTTGFPPNSLEAQTIK